MELEERNGRDSVLRFSVDVVVKPTFNQNATIKNKALVKTRKLEANDTILMLIKPHLSCKQTFFFFHFSVDCHIQYVCFKMVASALFKASTHHPHPALLLFSASTLRLRSLQEVLSNAVTAETTRCLASFTSEQWRYSPQPCHMPHPAISSLGSF